MAPTRTTGLRPLRLSQLWLVYCLCYHFLLFSAVTRFLLAMAPTLTLSLEQPFALGRNVVMVVFHAPWLTSGYF